MGLFLEFEKNGLTKQVEIVPNLMIGRSKGQIILPDSKVSSLHAMVERQRDGSLSLVDQSSRNGIVVNKKRMCFVRLAHGVSFAVGRTTFTVVEIENTHATVVTDDDDIETKATIDTWQKHLWDLATAAAGDLKINKKKQVTPFEPALELEIIQGRQFKTKWTLGYGPRFIGPLSMEFPLLEPHSPEICFAVRQSKKGPEFITQHPDKVLLNGKPKKTEILKSGDEISIHDTKIKVNFIL